MHTNAVLASYATFKELYSSQKYKTPYQILSEFLRYTISINTLRDFTVTDLRGKLNKEFEFDLPAPVIIRALTEISGITILDQGEGYRADLKKVKRNNAFQEIIKKASEESKKVTELLLEYKPKGPIYGKVENEKLTEEFISYLLDDEESNHSRYISQFILDNQGNEELTSIISTIREGSILYSGLTYHVDDALDNISPITFYLDTEVLFDIAGLNGSLLQTIAEDLLILVDNVNKNGKVITLRYFSEVKRDIENFFGSVSYAVKNNELIIEDAMRQIAENCTCEADVMEKKALFYRNLHINKGIRLDEKENYYTEEDKPYNLEGEIAEFPSHDEKNHEAIKYCSKINKLRQNRQTVDILKSEYLCVTRTYRVLEVSKFFSEKNRNPQTGEKYCGYAIGLSNITNVLWEALNRGFGMTNFPANLDVVIKARILLSGYITQKITETYDKVKEQRKNKQITEDEAASVIIELRKKKSKPEDLFASTIAEDMDFSDGFLNRNAEERANDKRIIEEKTGEVSSLLEKVGNLEEELRLSINREKDNEKVIRDLSEWKSNVESDRLREKKKDLHRCNIVKLVLRILGKIVLITAVLQLGWYVCKWLEVDYPTWSGWGISLLGIILSGLGTWKKDIKKFSDEKNKIDQMEIGDLQ